MASTPQESPLVDELAALGIAFVTDENTLALEPDPEKTFLKSISEWNDQRKTLKLLLAWMEEYGDLFHVERMRYFAGSLSAIEIAWLGGFASHQVSRKDLRWQAIEKFCHSKLGTPMPQFTTSTFDLLQAERNGKDPHFEKYGLILQRLEPSDPKKIYLREGTLKRNGWLRLRLLFGSNFRADMAYLFLRQKVSNAFQAEKFLGCSRETAYRLWKAFKEVECGQILKV
jgi:hypothetical protein